MATIYLALLDEAVEIWRPVEALPLLGDTYRIEGEVPDDEVWAFPPGTVVRCEQRSFYGGENVLAAIEIAD